jgi:hypothetical protein
MHEALSGRSTAVAQLPFSDEAVKIRAGGRISSLRTVAHAGGQRKDAEI